MVTINYVPSQPWARGFSPLSYRDCHWCQRSNSGHSLPVCSVSAFHMVTCFHCMCQYRQRGKKNSADCHKHTNNKLGKENQISYRIILIRCTMHLLLFCTTTNKSTIISQIITLLHVSTLSCHPQTACNQYLAKIHQYFERSCQ
jgi:hypothetical protein